MARTLVPSAGTISRELARNACARRVYASVPAQALSRARRVQARPRPKLEPQGVLWGVLLTLLDGKWSPQQIAGNLSRVWPDDPRMQVSRQTMYAAIYAQPQSTEPRVALRT